jgi:hypothetical protein
MWRAVETASMDPSSPMPIEGEIISVSDYEYPSVDEDQLHGATGINCIPMIASRSMQMGGQLKKVVISKKRADTYWDIHMACLLQIIL